MAKQKRREPNLSFNSMDDKSARSLIDAAREGIPFSQFLNIAQSSPFTLTEWSNYLHVSERTLQRYKKEKRTFDTLQSEKILHITLLYNTGTELFGSAEKFNAWLEADNLVLHCKPKELLDSMFGIELLRDELTRIEHGVLA
jgi:putative toxin-antitoxin system antitoxin component (TIGR02293 family)